MVSMRNRKARLSEANIGLNKVVLALDIDPRLGRRYSASNA
jgi:hypothetical protein